MLIVFGGLPGVGKTTLARELVARLGAVYLRIDTIEQAIRNAGVLAGDVGAAGYVVANALAEANLVAGRMVVADCVNPVAESRAGWRGMARRAAVRILEIEVICSDKAAHRRRVEGRVSDIPGLVPPDWAGVLRHEYENWEGSRLVIDTAVLSPDAAMGMIEGEMRRGVG